jgi:cellulose synthase/poly-beta-1,6-N-acetylglucosamine synthase-like glycosyltransferase
VSVNHVLGALGVLLLGSGLYLRLGTTRTDTLRPSFQHFAHERGDASPDTRRLYDSIEGLRVASPAQAVDDTLSFEQKQGLLIAATVTAGLMAISWNLTMIAVVGIIIFFYFASLIVRLVLFVKALNGRGNVRVSDEVALAVDPRRLPRYSVLVPAYGEPEVMSRLIPNLTALDYPADKLEVLLLLEADDEPTIAAARAVLVDHPNVELVLVPPSDPRTKPKALNYGLQRCTGDIVTIYDAEDRPEPLQLRKAALALDAAPDSVACVQARLDFFNPTQNLITKWFTLDYRMWFTQLLPGLVQLGAPIPLGGTSNHFKRNILIEIGAWDAYNVTEDADLGIRLHRRGYRTGVVDSTTYEEANSDFVNWVKQRSRWYKGYVQTSLVHLRQPRQLYRELGGWAFLLFLLFVVGTPVLATLNPVFWTVTIVWFIWHPAVIQHVIPTLTYFVGQFSWIGGNALVLYSWLLSTREPKEHLWLAAILAPLYWMMMALAATKAVIQLITAPSYWEKTQHGLDMVDEPVTVAA